MNPIHVIEEKNKRKKDYLNSEIKVKGYDPEDYIDYLISTKEGKNLSLDDFTLSDLQATIIHFQFKCKKKLKEKWRPITSKLGLEIFGTDDGNELSMTQGQQSGLKIKKEDLNKKDSIEKKEEKFPIKKEKMENDKEEENKVVKQEDAIKNQGIEEKNIATSVENKEIANTVEEKHNVNRSNNINKSIEENKDKSKSDNNERSNIKKEDTKIEVKDKDSKEELNKPISQIKEEVIKSIDQKQIDVKPIEQKKEEIKTKELKKDDIKLSESKKEEVKPTELKTEKEKPIELKKEEVKTIDNKNKEVNVIDKTNNELQSIEQKKEEKTSDKKVESLKEKDKKQKEIEVKSKEKTLKKDFQGIEKKEDNTQINRERAKSKDEFVKNRNKKPIEKDSKTTQEPIIIHSTESTRDNKKKDQKPQPEIPSKEEPTNALVLRDQNINTMTNLQSISKENALITYIPSQTITTTKEATQHISKEENKTHSKTHSKTTTTVTKKEQVSITQIKTQTSVVDLNKSGDDLHSTGIVKQEKAFKPMIDPEAQKKKNEEMYGAFLQSSEDIPCVKQEKNIFTDVKDLEIKITNPEWVKNGLFSFTYYQYTVSCAQTETEVTRKLDDFEWLRKKLETLYPGTFLPPFPPNVYRVKNDSPKKVLYMQRFINSLARLKLIRSSPIFADFITISQVDFATMRKTYDKLERPKTLPEYQKMDGLVKITISKEQDAKAMQIPKDITTRSLLFDKLFYSIDCLMTQFDEMAKRFSEVSKVLHEMQGTYANCSPAEDKIGNAFGQLSILMGSWEQGYNAQKTFFRDDVKYYFKFMQKELNTFNNLVEELRQSRNSYNYLFAKVNRKEILSDKESKDVTSLQKFYGYYLYSTMKEYERLNRKHAKRFEKQFAYMSENKDKFLSDYNHFVSLLNYEVKEPEILNKE